MSALGAYGNLSAAPGATEGGEVRIGLSWVVGGLVGGFAVAGERGPGAGA